MNIRKIVAGAVTALLVGGGLALAVAAPASAHTSKVTGVATCEDDGSYTVLWTYNATNVPDGVEAETKALHSSPGFLYPVDGVDKGGQIFLSVWSDHQVNVPGAPVKTGNWTAQFASKHVAGSATQVTTMVQTDWKGGPSEDPIGQVILDGTCKPKSQPPTTPTEIVLPALTATPPTCDTDGTLPFLGNPAAQNPNGYEFPGQGFRVYLSTGFTGPGTYTATLQKVGPGFDPAFPAGTKVTGETKQTLVVTGKTGFQGENPEAPCYVAVPPTSTTYGEWSTPVIDCDTEVGAELGITREATTVTSTLDTVTGVVSSTSETVTERDVHIVTQAEIDALDCPLPPVTPEEPTTPATPEEPVTPVLVTDVVPMGGDEGILAQTGGELSPLPWVAGGLALVLGALLLVGARLRRRQGA